MAEAYYSRACMLEMPTEYKELSEEEKEYDGSIFNVIGGLAMSVIGVGISTYGKYK